MLARLLWIILSGLAATVRFRWKDESGAFETEPDKPVIFCIWHNRLALSLIFTASMCSPDGRDGAWRRW